MEHVDKGVLKLHGDCLDLVNPIMGLQFEWDEEKEKLNRKKHRVAFEEAATVFGDPLAAVFDDMKHSDTNHARSSSDTRPQAVSCWSVSPNVRKQSVSSAHVERRDESERIMKKTQSADPAPEAPGEMMPEYCFDYNQARPNRFAEAYESGSRVVVLDPDVAEVFTTTESVNSVLRALLATMPKQRED